MQGLMCLAQGHNPVALARLEAGDWDCVAVIERLPALHYSADFFLSFGILGFILEL